MSMLAERRRERPGVLNPRKSAWSEDTTKFGQKLLEKMGWTPGKGLGAREQGISEPLRVRHNANAKGLGFTFNEKGTWVAQQEDFQQLLVQLNGGAEEEPTRIVSLEEKSQKSKTRVHYHKFTRGKDLARYSEKDLNCILPLSKQWKHTPVESLTGAHSDKETREHTEPAECEVISKRCPSKKRKKEKDVQNDTQTEQLETAPVKRRKKKSQRQSVN